MRRGVSKTRNGSIVSIPRAITHGRELVVLTRKEYERAVGRTQEVVEALHMIAEGERAYREGRTLKASSLE
ncbi:MAG: hypothetical protein HYZ72_10080, partial [Deltaproteobacteria bacterium]|nr:hypothetical protein [Deltaproteobacteria bacterium]